MGVGRSKAFPISYEEACKRVPGTVLQRLQETFKRLSTGGGYLPQLTFTRDVLGETVPVKLSEAIYGSFGGGHKGIGYKDLVCGLVLLVHGTKQEKARFIAQLVTDDGDKITREALDSLVIACDLTPSRVNLDTLFGDGTTASIDEFEEWLLDHPQLASFTLWLLSDLDECGFSLEGHPDPPSFHQTLAQRFSVDEQVVMDLEKSYWALKGGGKFDLPTLESYVSPPLPVDLSTDLFRVMDLNSDGHIDLSELIQMVAVCCRGDNPHKFCFRLFDHDEDGLLSRGELLHTVQHLREIKQSNLLLHESAIHEQKLVEELTDKVLKDYSKEKEGHLTEMEYFDWTKDCDLGNHLVKILIEICHVRFGLRPLDPEQEGVIINGYLNRFHKAGRRHGDLVYIISQEWFQRWKVYTSQEDEASLKPHSKKNKRKAKSRNKSQQIPMQVINDASPDTLTVDLVAPPPVTGDGSTTVSLADGDLSPLRPPPIDNSLLCVSEPSGSKKLPSLTNEGGCLLKTKVLIENKDYVLLPETVWRVFVSWYGTAGYNILSLPRIVGPDGEIQLYPLFFKLYRHTTNPLPAKPSNLPWPIASILTSMGVISSGAPPPVSGPLLAGDESGQPPQPRRVPYYQAAFTKTTTLAEMNEKIQQILRVSADDLRLYDLTEEDAPVLLEDEQTTLEQLNMTDGQKLLIETRNKDNSWPEEIISILKEVSLRDKEKPRPPISEVRVPQGATGLSNLGNTCFMNSALQCVSNARPLTTYFRERDHLCEINKDNPLGTGGVMAKRYGELVDDLWTGNSKSITPLKFRFTVGRYAPQFNAFQQQDCQELLAFVLDGLHEDLNRVKDKAYRELNDSDGRDDAIVAQEAWDYHLSRNQSIIVDLFQGQLKSEVTCKVCQYQSVRFDPFTFLSLPLPMESTVNLEVIVVLLDGSQPMRYGLKLELDDKYRQLKQALSGLCGVSPAHLLLVEVYGGMIRNLPSDSTKIRSVLGGWLYAYEVPPPPLVAPTSRADSPDESSRQLKVEEVKRERALSFHKLQEEKKRAEIARATYDVKSHDQPESHAMDTTESHDIVTESHDKQSIPNEGVSGSHDVEPGSHDIDEPMEVSASEVGITESGLEECDGFVFAVHRRMFSVEQYFVSCQKNRPVIFGTPLVVPCESGTPRRDLYENVWGQVQRLIIPDPPNKTSSPDHGSHYPFVLKLVAKNGFSCGICPWYKFCHGCVLGCDDVALGRTAGYIAVDWDTTALHLKYQSAQERPLEHESMESLKVTDNKPIDLYECFKAFVRQDELGDEESWYCKHCKTHREAIKSLEIWKLPPILIIHLKRFQFFNGRWVKSQRAVTFPMMNLDPLRYTAQNSNGSGDHTTADRSCNMECEPNDESHDQCSESGDQLDGQQDESGDQHNESGDQSHDQQGESGDTDVMEEAPISAATNEMQSSNLYNLFAICCHSGVMGGGHYVSFVKNTNKKWYYFNDSSCKETSEDRVNEESPYMLFYELNGLEQDYNKYRVQSSGGKGQDIGTEDDKEFEETLKNLRKTCTIQ